LALPALLLLNLILLNLRLHKSQPVFLCRLPQLCLLVLLQLLLLE
jgi:hypothetical protein